MYFFTSILTKMNAREFVIPIISFSLGVNILMVRDYHYIYQIIYFAIGMVAPLLAVIIMDDCDRKAKRKREEM